MKITDIEVNESIELGDNFDIELGNTIIESRVVGFMDDGVVLEADDKALALLGIGGALLEATDNDYWTNLIADLRAKAEAKDRERWAAQAAIRDKETAEQLAKDRENLPTLEKYLTQLQSEYDPYYEYSDDHRVWTKNREIKARISNLQQRIKDAKGLTESKSFGPENPYEVKPGEDFSLVFKPGKRSGVHYHMNSGMVADPFYFVLNGKLYSVTNQGDGIPKEVQQGVQEQQNVAEVASRESVNIDMFDRRKTPADLLLKYLENQGFEEISYKSVMKPFQKDVYRFVSPAGRKLKAEYGYTGWNLQGPALNDINFDDVAKLFKTDIYSDGKPIASGKENSDEQAIAEGRMKEQMHTDAERMELAEFVDKYGDEDWVKEFWQNVNADINEAKYQGREVPLGKPMQGDVKKSKVYVRGPKGNVVKVNFGDKNMKIKKSNPKRRKSFRARHNCANPGPRWKARYWSCRAW